MSKLSVSLVIGGAVASSLGSAFRTAESGIQKLEQKANKTKVLKSAIGETIKLREEWKKAHDSGAASAAGLLRKLDRNLDSLRKQGIQVGKLNQEYLRLGRTAKATDLQIKGRQQLNAGKEGLQSTAVKTTAAVAMAAVPTAISAGFQGKIRDIAIKANIANTPEEKELAQDAVRISQDTGMGRNEVADLVNQLVGAGMDLNKARAYAPVAAKFAVGQGASGEDTARMIQALEQNAKITDPKEMEKALEGIAYQGQAGSFEASDMARWFPALLAGMEKSGSTGLDAVSELGAMLQVQMKTAGSSDEAANNFKNWVDKIGSGEVVDAYKKAGIDYQKSLNTGVQKGMSVIESSMALALQYVEKTDPAKAKKMADAKAKIDKEVDPVKARKMLEALEQTLRTGDIFADSQVKAALTAYGQNRGFYADLKQGSKSEKAAGILDKNLEERRETSAQRWIEAKNAVDDSLRSIGDALRPMTDWLASNIKNIAQEFTKFSDSSKAVIAGIATVGGGFLALQGLLSSFKVVKGLFNVGRGSLMGDPSKVQKVFVTNSGESGDGDGEGKSEGKRGKVLDLVEFGLKKFQGDEPAEGDGEAGEGEKKKGFQPLETGLKVLDILREASNHSGDDDGEGGGSDPQKVFVVNADAFGNIGAAGRGAGPGQGPGDPPDRRRRRDRTRNRRRGPEPGGPPGPPSPNPPDPGRRRSPPNPPRPEPAPRPPVPPTPPVPPVPPAPSRLAQNFGAVVRAGRKVAEYGKRIPGGNLLDAGLGLADVAMNAETQDEKAEGYGGVAGSVAGTMAGAAAGAAIGSVVPVIGTAVGALVGAYLGSTGGEMAGSWLGKALFGEKEKPAEEVAETAKPAPEAGDVVRSLTAETPAPPAVPLVAKAPAPAKPDQVKVDQSFTFAPNLPVTVQGDVKDPGRLAEELMPHIRRQFDDYARQQQARQLSDEPHI